jgi:hypothetical protein
MLRFAMSGLNGAMHRPVSYGAFMASVGNLETESYKDLCRKKEMPSKSVFLNRRTAGRYRALASIIPGRERPEKTTICYRVLLVQLITNLNAILCLSTCHTVYISVLIPFMIMP